MNTCMTITCETCEKDIDCRIGYSNRRIQPLAFSCPLCDSPLGITLDTSHAPGRQGSSDKSRVQATAPDAREKTNDRLTKGAKRDYRLY